MRTARSTLGVVVSLAFAALMIGCSSGGGGGGAPSYSISGTVTGAWVEGVTVALSGGGLSPTTTTGVAGTYSFTGLPDGTSYTVTPSLPGYTFGGSPATVPIAGANATQDFTSSSTVASYGISGTVTYAGSSGTPTSRIYVNAHYASCPSCSPAAGTSIANAPPRTFTIRGLTPGAYQLRSRLDNLGTGSENASNPSGSTGTINVIAASVSGTSLTLSDPSAPTLTAVTNVAAMPGPGVAVIFWDAPRDGSGREAATGYRIKVSSDVGFTSPNNIDIPATDQNPYLHTGTAGTTWYYRVAARYGATVGPDSASVGPVTLSAPAGGSTVNTSVTFPGNTGRPLYVGFFQLGSGGGGGPTDLRIARVASPVSGTAYPVDGVSAGTWYPFAIIDQNGNNVIDLGDFQNTGGDSAPTGFTAPTASTIPQTLSGASALATVATQHWWDGATSHSYYLVSRVATGVKLPVKVAVVSGRGLPLPIDLGRSPDNNGSYQFQQALGSTAPTVGDGYQFRVTYADDTSEALTGTVTVVPAFFPATMGETTTGSYTRNIPLFTWTAPASPPTSYGYYIQVDRASGGTIWQYPNNGPAMESSQTEVAFDADASASQPSLTTGTAYDWQLVVIDEARNMAIKQRAYTP